jgi:predicted nucleic acid-binding protein
MKLSDELDKIETIFIDTAPIIYYIEAHHQFGSLVNEVVKSFLSGKLIAFTSVITLAEVLSKPIGLGKIGLAERFTDFLRHGNNINLLEITADIAEKAGILRGYYRSLKLMDAIQISTALEIKADSFLTNDARLKQVSEIKVLVLKDYL